MTHSGAAVLFRQTAQKVLRWLPPGGGWSGVYLAVAGAVLAGHLPELGGWVSCNPIKGYAGMLLGPLHQALPGRCSMDANDGITLQALGGRAADMWLHGRLPWWNTYSGLGLPLAAEAQPAALFLPFVLLLHFVAGLLVLKMSLQVIAGVFMVALLGELGLGRAAAGVGGVLFALNGTYAWFSDSPMLPVAFLPALLFALERCRSAAIAKRGGGPAWVALALAFSLVAGFPETAFMDGLLAGVWAAAALQRTPSPRRWALARKICCGGLAGMALSAPAWVSFLDYLRISDLGAHGFVVLNHLEPKQAAALLMPALFGPPYADGEVKAWTDCGGYFGAAFALLAVLGPWTGGRFMVLRWAMAGWVIFWLSVFFSLPIAHAVWLAAPGLNQIQVTRYAMPTLECAAVVLAALTVDEWYRSGRIPRAGGTAAGLGGLAVALLVPAAQAGRLWYVRDAARVFPFAAAFHGAAILQAAFAVAALTWILAARRSEMRAAMVVLVVSLDASISFMAPQAAGMKDARLDMAPIQYLQSHAGMSRFYTFKEQIPTSYGSWFGVAHIQANSVPYATVWDEAARSIGGYVNMSISTFQAEVPGAQIAAFRAAAPALRSAAVRYVVVPAADDPFAQPPEPGMVRVFADAGTHIYEMAGAANYLEVQGGPCTLAGSTRDLVHASCAGPAILLRHELLLPGWHVSINSRKTVFSPSLSPGQPAFQRIALKPGAATVRWWYTPPRAALMAWLCGLGAAATLWFAIGPLPVKRRDGA